MGGYELFRSLNDDADSCQIFDEADGPEYQRTYSCGLIGVGRLVGRLVDEGYVDLL